MQLDNYTDEMPPRCGEARRERSQKLFGQHYDGTHSDSPYWEVESPHARSQGLPNLACRYGLTFLVAGE